MGERQFDLKDHLDWRIAICYHPMYMVVDEDRGVPVLAERKPPWAAANVEEYMERVGRNIKSLEDNPGLKLNYEWASHSLEDLSARFPEIFARMKAAHNRGQLDFVGGEYSLAHTMAHSSESAWRQFEYGLEIMDRLFGKKMTTHAHQESHIYSQLPQLLRLFGYRYMVMPSFPWTIDLTSASFRLLGHERGTYIEKGNEMIDAEAPDGTTIPAYFATNVRQTKWHDEMMKDLWGCPPLWIDFPDLEEYHNPNEMAEPVLLEEEVARRLSVAPPKSTARLHTYYAYAAEGIWAEEHLRTSKSAEETAVVAEAMLAMAALGGRTLQDSVDMDDIWRTILKYQDHDATWIEVTDLRRKAINKFTECIDQSRNVIEKTAVQMVAPSTDTATIFNTLPVGRRALIACDLDLTPADATLQLHDGKAIGFVELPSFGCRTFPLGANPTPSVQEPVPTTIDARDYSVQLSPEGLIESMSSDAGDCVISGSGYHGGEIRAVSEGLWVDNRGLESSFSRGDVCCILERKGKIAGVPLIERYFFFLDYPLVKVQLHFEFDGNAVGDFHIMETKLNIYYPTGGNEAYHDVPFGYSKCGDREQAFALNWFHCGGLTYVNRGTATHWLKDGVVGNQIGWGGKEWTNRIHYEHWMKLCADYDLRLYGTQTVEYSLIPSGEFDDRKVFWDTQSLATTAPMVRGSAEGSYLQTADAGIAVTGIYQKDGTTRVRGLKMPGEGGPISDWQIFDLPIDEAAKEGVTQ